MKGQQANKRSSFTPKPCPECGSKWHSKSYHKERKPMSRGIKPMNKKGKVTIETEAFVDKWKRTQKPNHEGYYICYISGQWVEYLMAEHPYSKTRHPEFRTDQILEPVHADINKLKGSLDIHDFLRKYPQYIKTVKKEYLVGFEL